MENENQEIKLYCLNGDGSSEWIFAKNKYEALELAARIWGICCVLEQFKEHLLGNPDDDERDFIEYFVQEEPGNKIFTFTHLNGQEEIKSIDEWIKDAKECPSYFASEEY